MYAAHVGPALAARGFLPRVPLWVLLAASYAPDVASYGIEVFRGRPPGLLDAYLLPTGAAMAVVLGVGYAVVRSDRVGGLAVALTAASHLVLDALAWGLSLWPGGPTPDVRLAGRPVWWLVAEFGIVAAGWLVYRRSLAPERRRRPAAWGVLLVPAAASAAYYLFELARWRP